MESKVCTNCNENKEFDEFIIQLDAINKARNKENHRRYYIKNREKLLNKSKQYGAKHKSEKREYDKKYREDNLKKKKEYDKKYRRENKDERNEYERKKLATDINYKIIKILRGRVCDAIRHNYKAGSSVQDLGCSVEFLKQYLESKFYPNSENGEQMTWDNHGLYGWHIDHIIPLSSFDLTDRAQFLKACHYTNLQPLWAKENLEKGDKIIFEEI